MPKTLVEERIRVRIDAFVTELNALVRQAAVESVDAALSGSVTMARRTTGRPSKSATSKHKTAGKRIRRSSADVDATAVAVIRQVKANPGQGVTDIGAALGLSSKDLKLPIKKLLEEKKVRTTGQRRGTKYHPAGRGGTGTKKKTAKKARRKATKRRATKKTARKTR